MGDFDYDYILCEDCENLVPETSLVKHQAEACEARARPPRSFLPQTPLNAVQQQNVNNGLTASADARLVRPIPSTMWSCSRCGRNNSQTRQSCEACQHQNADARRPDPIRPSGDNVNSRRNASHSTNQYASIWNVGGHAQNPNVHHVDPIRLSGNNVNSRRNTSLSNNQHASLWNVGGYAQNPNVRHTDPTRLRGNNVNSRRNTSLSNNQHASLWNVGGHAQNPNVRHADPIQPSGDRVNARRNVSPSTNQHAFLLYVGGHFIQEIYVTAFSMSADHGAHQQYQQRGNRSYEELLRRFGNGAENMGASESDILSLPNKMISNVEIDLPEVNARQCCICLDDFQAGHMLTTLPCRHGFHLDCINKALRIRGRCPLCNATVKR